MRRKRDKYDLIPGWKEHTYYSKNISVAFLSQTDPGAGLMLNLIKGNCDACPFLHLVYAQVGSSAASTFRLIRLLAEQHLGSLLSLAEKPFVKQRGCKWKHDSIGFKTTIILNSV